MPRTSWAWNSYSAALRSATIAVRMATYIRVSFQRADRNGSVPEPVTRTANRLNNLIVACLGKLAAHVFHVHLQDIAVTVDVLVPQPHRDLIPREHLALVAEEELQERELLRRQGNDASPDS